MSFKVCRLALLSDQANRRAYVQGGDNGMPILGDFAIKFGSRAEELGVPTDDLYQALIDTAENTVCAFSVFDTQVTDCLASSRLIGTKVS